VRHTEGVCGRYVNVASTADLTDEFDVQETLGEDLPPSWNVAPTDPVRIITRRRPHGSEPDTPPVTQLRTAKWGLLPSWSKSRSGGAKMINARIETITKARAFKAATGRRRSLAPALGYYEWQNTDYGKQPYFLHAPDDQPLAFASLYEIWRDPALPDEHPDKWVWTTTIITRAATDALGYIHDRCPVIIPADLRAAWLDCGNEDPASAQELLDQIPEPHLEPRVVGNAVGNVRNNGPELIRAAPTESVLPMQIPLDL
jgi:putative SOS response-associated peptidase YedK